MSPSTKLVLINGTLPWFPGELTEISIFIICGLGEDMEQFYSCFALHQVMLSETYLTNFLQLSHTPTGINIFTGRNGIYIHIPSI